MIQDNYNVPDRRPVHINVFKTVVAPNEYDKKVLPNLSGAPQIGDAVKIGGLVLGGLLGVTGIYKAIEATNQAKIGTLNKLLTSSEENVDDGKFRIEGKVETEEMKIKGKDAEILSAIVDYSDNENFSHYKISSNEWDSIYHEINDIEKDFLVVEDSDNWRAETKIPIFIFSKGNIFNEIEIVKGESYTIRNIKENAPFLYEIINSLSFEGHNKFVFKLLIEYQTDVINSQTQYKSKFKRDDDNCYNFESYMCYYENNTISFKQK